MGKRYRIVVGSAYNGCIPITVYWVQVREDKTFSTHWCNIKGYEDKQKAVELLKILEK